MLVSLLWVSELLSVVSRLASLVSSSFLSFTLKELLSVETSASFRTPVSLRDVVALWDESGFCLGLCLVTVSWFSLQSGLHVVHIWVSFSPLTCSHLRFP